jgi:CHAT domain-containing protein
MAENWRAYEDLLFALREIHQEREAFDYSERGRARVLIDLIGGPNARTLTLTAAEKRMQPGDLLLDYILGDRRSYLWAVTAEGTKVFELPGRANIVDRVNAFRQAIAMPPGSIPAPFRNLAHGLYRTLCGPAEDLIRQSARITIVPDGVLHYLPFEALIGSDEKYLVENTAVAYAPSASALALLKHPSSETARFEFLGVGAPHQATGGFGRPSGFSPAPLLNAQRELAQIAALFPRGQSSLLAGSKATTAGLRAADLGTYRRIHFATHTLLDERAPGQTGLVLAEAADGSDNGILRAREIRKLRLHAELVVLSACQTGVGRLMRGEGISGLSSAFLDAGAERVVVTGWAVNDIAAADVMREFYSRMSKGGSPAAALRDAKTAMLKTGSAVYRHPYYWAPYVLIGNF